MTIFVRRFAMAERAHWERAEIVEGRKQDERLEEWLNSFHPAVPVSIQELYRTYDSHSGQRCGYFVMFSAPD